MLELRNLAALPSSATRDAARSKASQELFDEIETPGSNDDARALVKFLGPDIASARYGSWCSGSKPLQTGRSRLS